jgi:hypothetical protein
MDKRVRKKKTKSQRQDAAVASRKHRDRIKAELIPTGRQIDTAIATLLVKKIEEPDAPGGISEQGDALIRSVIVFAGWKLEAPMITAIENRVRFLIDKKWSS